MQTKTLIKAENILSEIYVMIAAQRGNETIDSDLILKVIDLDYEETHILREVRHNKRELDTPAFIRYRADLTRVFTKIIQSVDNLLPGYQATENTGAGPDGFKINNDYTVTDVQQFLHNVFFSIDSAIDKEFPEPGADMELSELNTVYEMLLLLRHSGVYEQIYNICGKNKARTAALIAAITGEKEGSIRTISTHFETPHIKSNSSPYTKPAVDKIITLLIKLGLDATELIKISEKMHQNKA